MFNFSSQEDQIRYAMLNKLVKKHDGWFQTKGHCHFGFNALDANGISGISCEDAKTLFGIELFTDASSQRLLSVDASVNHSSYGARGLMPVIWKFVTDSRGVVAKYKLGGRGNLRDGWKPDPAKTVLEWSRDANADVPGVVYELEQAAAEAAERKRIADKELYEKQIALKLCPPLEENKRILIEGEILGTYYSTHETPAGPVGSMRMHVRHESGLQLTGSIPNSLIETCRVKELRGKTVQFMGRVRYKEDDDFAAWYSRPTKAKLLDEITEDA